MMRRSLPIELICAIGLLLTVPSAFAFLFASQAGNATWIALTVTGFVVGIGVLTVASRRS